MKKILKTSDPALFSLARALLNRERIMHFMLDVRITSPEGEMDEKPRTLMVRAEDEARARKALRQLSDFLLPEDHEDDSPEDEEGDRGPNGGAT